MTISVVLDYTSCVITGVYASTSVVRRRQLWIAIVCSAYASGPWLTCGDLNAMLEAHEKSGPVCRRLCEEFKAISYICELVHIDTKGSKLILARRRGIRGNVELRLGRCRANLNWLGGSVSFPFFALFMLRSQSIAHYFFKFYWRCSPKSVSLAKDL